MNKIKVMPGQVWKCVVIGGPSIRTVREVIDNHPYHNDVFFTDENFMKENDLHQCGIFIPSGDLEWLACNVDEWKCESKLIFKQDLYNFFIFTDKRPWGEYTRDCYTKQQWQDKRYELGLDERTPDNTEDFTGKFKGFKREQKEDNKLKLTKDDVGKEFECELGNVFEITAFDKVNAVAKSKEDNGYFIINHDGSFFAMGTRLNKKLVKRHEPRWWLSQLPDTNLFDCNWIASDYDGAWYHFNIEPTRIIDGCFLAHENDSCAQSISGIKMPKLKGDEYKLSKISIDELRVIHGKTIKIEIESLD